MKIKVIAIIIHILFAITFLYLFKMQVIDYSYYKERSEKNRVRPVILEAPRGRILDRNGKELVGNRLSFDCYLVPQSRASLTKTFYLLSRILGVSEEVLWERYEKRMKSRVKPVLIAKDIEKEHAIQLEEGQITGLFIKTKPVRQYHLGAAAAHVLGYIGPINAKEYGRMKGLGYRKDDRIGRDGIERVYDSYLRGEHGASQFEVDNRGRLLKVLSIQDRKQGKSLEVTLDGELQQYTYDQMKSFRGSAVAMELESGGILTLVSKPSFDPNIFIGSSTSGKAIRELLTSQDKPLLNRAVSGEYPPGSTFKIISAMAGLEAGVINSSTRFFCPGSYHIKDFEFRCWRQSGHGSQDLKEALQHSCNVFFYSLGHKLGVDRLVKISTRFGLGRVTGIDIPQEKKGLVPSPEWKRKHLKQKWYGGETLNYVIGQGYLLTTPIQILESASLIATRGKYLQPYLTQSINQVDVTPNERKKKLKMKKYHRDLIEIGLERVVNTNTGTGQRAQSDDYTVVGKTGTAQAPRGQNHAWFVGYAPLDNPKAAVVVLLENGGKGGVHAADIAGKMFAWLGARGYLNP